MKIDEIRLIDVVSKNNTLFHKGNNYICHCPFPSHNDKTPSFTIYLDTNRFYCFGCKKAGGVIEYYTYFYNLSRTAAYNKVCSEYDVEVDEIDNYKVAMNDPLLVYLIMCSNTYLFHFDERDADIALSYLQTRGINHTTASHFEVGYCSSHLFDGGNMIDLGNYYPKYAELLLLNQSTNGVLCGFRGRIFFPIYSSNGAITMFGARSINSDSPKYLYSRNYDDVTKSSVLYNYWKIDTTKDLIVCEGVFDVWALFQNNEPNCVALLGSSFSKEHINLLEKYPNKIYLSLDNDQAGMEGTIKLLQSNVIIRKKSLVIQLPLGKDPHEYLITHKGGDVKNHAINASIFLANHIIESSPRITHWDFLSVLHKIFKICKDDDYACSSIITLASSKIGVSIDSVTQRYVDYLAHHKAKSSELVHVTNGYYYIQHNESIYLIKDITSHQKHSRPLYVMIVIPIRELSIVGIEAKFEQLEFDSKNNTCVFTSEEEQKVVEMIKGWHINEYQNR